MLNIEENAPPPYQTPLLPTSQNRRNEQMENFQTDQEHMSTIDVAPTSNGFNPRSQAVNFASKIFKSRGFKAGTVLIATAALVIFSIYATIHHVQEGYVAVYYRGGALLNQISRPGYHLKLPITSYRQIQVTLQTDEVRNVPCGTAGGVIITFGRIEVVNILRLNSVIEIVRNYTWDYEKPLIFNKIHHEINQFCSKHTIQEVYIDLFDTIDENLSQALEKDLMKMAPGLEVLAVRVTKPIVPEVIRQNYEEMEAEKTQLLVATQHQRVVEKLAETAKKKALIEAEKESHVAAVHHKMVIAKKEMEKTVNKLQDEIHLAKQKASADAEYYTVIKQAEANDRLLKPNYLELRRIEAIEKNNKVYYGESIPKAFFTEKANQRVARSYSNADMFLDDSDENEETENKYVNNNHNGNKNNNNNNKNNNNNNNNNNNYEGTQTGVDGASHSHATHDL